MKVAYTLLTLLRVFDTVFCAFSAIKIMSDSFKIRIYGC